MPCHKTARGLIRLALRCSRKATDADNRFILQVVARTCMRLALPGLVTHISWTFRRLRGGQLAYTNFFGEIIIDRHWWKTHGPADRRFLLQHEVCHIVQSVRYDEPYEHGPQWAKLMRKLGIPRRRISPAFDGD